MPISKQRKELYSAISFPYLIQLISLFLDPKSEISMKGKGRRGENISFDRLARRIKRIMKFVRILPNSMVLHK